MVVTERVGLELQLYQVIGRVISKCWGLGERALGEARVYGFILLLSEFAMASLMEGQFS